MRTLRKNIFISLLSIFLINQISYGKLEVKSEVKGKSPTLPVIKESDPSLFPYEGPLIIPANKLKSLQYWPLQSIRLFRTNSAGVASPIPFQIDEKDEYDDYILDQGKNPTSQYADNAFSYHDELSFMGRDVGSLALPKTWPEKAPDLVYQIKLSKNGVEGAVFVGLYRKKAPPIKSKNLVLFDLANDRIVTSKYNYFFDKKNYVVVRDVNLQKPSSSPIDLLASSTFFIKADLKYFLTITMNQRSVDSELDAYKVGPIRAITRVNFNLNLLSMKFELGMYTEVSFFENSVILPAIIENPLDGDKVLNKGSLFYYGFAFEENPENLDIKTNIKLHPESRLNKKFSQNDPTATKGHYWLTASHPDYMIYLHFASSKQMIKSDTKPQLYLENVSGKTARTRPSEPTGLNQGPVNLAIALELDHFKEAAHHIAFTLFIDNKNDPETLKEYSDFQNWQVSLMKIKKF